MAIINVIHKLSDGVDRICGIVCTFLILSMVVLTGIQIVCRMFFTALAWSEEVCRYLLVWSTFIGAACVYKRSGHINVTAVRDLFPPVAQKAMVVLTQVLCCIFFVLVVYYGFSYMDLQSRQLSAALRIPMPWMYVAIPLSCGIMVLHVLDYLLTFFFEEGDPEVQP